MFTKEAIQELAQAQAITAANEAITNKTTVLSDKAPTCFEPPIALPNDFKLHNLEGYLTNRRRARGVMQTPDSKDFGAYIEKHKEDGAMVFVQPQSMTATAILNLGTPIAPGHADNIAVLEPKATAAYTALTRVADGKALTQQTVAEFLEDWSGSEQIECRNSDSTLSLAKSIAAVRKITIENMRKLESTEAQLSASKSTLESISASSTEPIPTFIYFKTVPYYKFSPRTFVLRLSVLTGGDKPHLTLRIINDELHDEEMAAELVAQVRDAVTDIAILTGQYNTKS